MGKSPQEEQGFWTRTGSDKWTMDYMKTRFSSRISGQPQGRVSVCKFLASQHQSHCRTASLSTLASIFTSFYSSGWKEQYVTPEKNRASSWWNRKRGDRKICLHHYEKEKFSQGYVISKLTKGKIWEWDMAKKIHFIMSSCVYSSRKNLELLYKQTKLEFCWKKQLTEWGLCYWAEATLSSGLWGQNNRNIREQ